jgi:hypothetical protein
MSGFTTRSWKGRQFTVLSLEGMDRDYVAFLSDSFFPDEYMLEKRLWAYAEMCGFRMRFSEELIKAMIEARQERNFTRFYNGS